MSPTAESTQSTQLLFVGQQCHQKQCYMVDFLPFKCDHCKHSFCAEHFKPEQHACEKFDPSKHDRIAPSCPFCNTPVAIPIGQDPNIRMEQHIDRECKVTTGKAQKEGGMPTCSRGRCGKRLFAPIRCDGCGKQFCPEHRYPSSHSCNTTPQSTSNISLPTSGARLANQTSAASAAAMAAIKRSMARSTPPKPAPTSPQTTQPSRKAIRPAASASAASGSAKHNNPFSKTDRCGSPSSAYETRTPISDSSSPMSSTSSSSPESQSESPSPVLPANRPRCNPFESILTTSWTPPSLFGTAS